jgi:hypothetical protein
MTPNNQIQLIYEVVRGERPCADLFHLGVKIEMIDDKWHFEHPHLEPVGIQISDVAFGLLKYRSKPSDLKKWARLILSCSFIDVSKCEDQTGWEVLLNALWDAMGTGKYSDSAFHLAEELAK